MNEYFFELKRMNEAEKRKRNPDEALIKRREALQDRLKEIGAMEIELNRLTQAKDKLVKSTIKFIEAMDEQNTLFLDLEQELMEDFLERLNKEMNDGN